MVYVCMEEALEQATKQLPLTVGLLETVNDIYMLLKLLRKRKLNGLCKEGYAITHRLLSSDIPIRSPTDILKLYA
jgi:hypothetical protein